MVFLTHLEFSFLEGLIRLCLVPRPLPEISCLARFFRDKTLGTTTIIGAVLRFFSLLRGAALQQRGAGMCCGRIWSARHWQPGFKKLHRIDNLGFSS